MVKFNPVDVFVGAGVGAALGPALDVLKEVVEKHCEFDPTFKIVDSTVKSLISLMPQLKTHNDMLQAFGNRGGDVEELHNELVEGKKLIEELSKVDDWSCWKAGYTDQLVELDESLKRRLGLLNLQGVIDGMENLVVTKSTGNDVKDISNVVNEVLAVAKGNNNQVAGIQAALTVGFSDVQKDLVEVHEEIAKRNQETEVLLVTKETNKQLAEIRESLITGLSDIQDIKRVHEEIIRGTEELKGRIQNQVKTGWLGVPEPPSFTVGLETQVKELKKKLLDNMVRMVQITGHPGAGKTTLAQSICEDHAAKEKFKIIFVNVSNRPNIEVVQEICVKASNELLEFQNEDIALDRLRQLLNNTSNDPILLVLDSVWPGHRTGALLKAVKSRHLKDSEMTEHKILVTSRVVLQGCDVEHQIEDLNEKDAMCLLRNSAGLTESSSIPEDLQKKVVQFCKRLPLVIEVIGGSLGKEVKHWRARIDAWSRGSPVIISQRDVLVRLQSSLDALGEENTIIKECVIDLASFPQGRMIPVSALKDMWKTDEDNSFIEILYKLTKWRMANLVITRNDRGDLNDGYYVEHFLIQHDLLRELAMQHTFEGPMEQRKRLIVDIREDKFPEWWKKKMDHPFHEVHLVSISTDSHFTSKWRDIQLPKAKILVLNLHSKNYEIPGFVEKMEKLKVLLVINGFLPAEVSNFSLLGSLFKLKTIWLERISISSITKNAIYLRRLLKISFFMCKMGPAFNRSSINFFEAFLELQEIDIDYCSDLLMLPDDICLLIHLKKLSVTNCHKLSGLPDTIGELVSLELLRLKSCTDLLEILDSVRKLKNLKALDISNCYSIKKLPEYIGEISSLEVINMRQCSRLNELPDSISDLEKLTDVICDEDTKGLWEPHLPNFENDVKIMVVHEKFSDFSLDWLLQ